jgi:hypothetical protein
MRRATSSRPAGNGENLLLRVRDGLEAADSQDGTASLLRSADGASGLHYRKLVVSDVNVQRMAACDWMVRIEVDDRWAAFPWTVDPIVKMAYLKASNTQSKPISRSGYKWVCP